MTDKHIEFLETSFVKQQREALPRSQLAFLMLGIDSFLTSAHPGRGSALDQFLMLSCWMLILFDLFYSYLTIYKFIKNPISVKIPAPEIVNFRYMW